MPSGLRFFSPNQVQAVSRMMSPVQPVLPVSVPGWNAGWDDKHANWGGSYIAFWSLKIQQQMRSLPKAGDSPNQVSGLAKRVAADPQLQVKLIAWLRSNFTGPNDMLKKLFAKYAPSTGVVHPGEFTWHGVVTRWVAQLACVHYLDTICMSSSGRAYNFASGECYSPGAPAGTMSGPAAVMMQTKPRMRSVMTVAPRPKPVLNLAITWDTTHPEWNGSFIAFWTTKIHEAIGLLRLNSSAFTLAPFAQRLIQDPNLDGKITTWLRGRFTGPQAFVQYIPSAGNNLMTLAQLGSLSYGNPLTAQIAYLAAHLYVNQVCRSAGPNIAYFPSTGQCQRVTTGTY
jgi:hypothetical protein